MADYRRNPYNRAGYYQQQGTMRQAMPSAASNTSCGSDFNLNQFPLAMAYVPWQQWNQTYELDCGLHAGTIFPELDKPFRGIREGGCCR